MDDATRPLREALAAAEAALRAPDPAAAEAAVRAGVEACERLAAAGVTPPEAELATLRDCHARVLARAAAVREELGRALGEAAQYRRAAAGYGRR